MSTPSGMLELALWLVALAVVVAVGFGLLVAAVIALLGLVYVAVAAGDAVWRWLGRPR